MQIASAIAPHIFGRENNSQHPQLLVFGSVNALFPIATKLRFFLLSKLEKIISFVTFPFGREYNLRMAATAYVGEAL
ncbi:MAG: hypothetical protein EOP00_21970 [Pedobacter sp.]|nr:MAG: hypothetical protein EOP00_21970 [Pedobacter sp.]